MPGAGRWCNIMSQEAAGITANLTAQIPPKGVRIQMFENTVLAAFNSKNSGWPASPLDSLTRRLVCREGKWLVYIHCPNSPPARLTQPRNWTGSFLTPTLWCTHWTNPVLMSGEASGKSRATETNDLRSLPSLSFEWDTQTRKQTLQYSKNVTQILSPHNFHEDPEEGKRSSSGDAVLTF